MYCDSGLIFGFCKNYTKLLKVKSKIYYLRDCETKKREKNAERIILIYIKQ